MTKSFCWKSSWHFFFIQYFYEDESSVEYVFMDMAHEVFEKWFLSVKRYSSFIMHDMLQQYMLFGILNTRSITNHKIIKKDIY